MRQGVSGIHGSEPFTCHLFRIATRFRATLLDEYMNSVFGVVSCRLSAMECLDDHGCDYHHQMVILPRSMVQWRKFARLAENLDFTVSALFCIILGICMILVSL